MSGRQFVLKVRSLVEYPLLYYHCFFFVTHDPRGFLSKPALVSARVDGVSVIVAEVEVEIAKNPAACFRPGCVLQLNPRQSVGVSLPLRLDHDFGLDHDRGHALALAHVLQIDPVLWVCFLNLSPQWACYRYYSYRSKCSAQEALHEGRETMSEK
jgi:hypothetical protein